MNKKELIFWVAMLLALLQPSMLASTRQQSNENLRPDKTIQAPGILGDESGDDDQMIQFGDKENNIIRSNVDMNKIVGPGYDITSSDGRSVQEFKSQSSDKSQGFINAMLELFDRIIGRQQATDGIQIPIKAAPRLVQYSRNPIDPMEQFKVKKQLKLERERDQQKQQQLIQAVLDSDSNNNILEKQRRAFEFASRQDKDYNFVYPAPIEYARFAQRSYPKHPIIVDGPSFYYPVGSNTLELGTRLSSRSSPEGEYYRYDYDSSMRPKRRRCQYDPTMSVKNPNQCDADAFFRTDQYTQSAYDHIG